MKIEIGDFVSFTTGSGWSHQGVTARVIAVGPEFIAAECTSTQTRYVVERKRCVPGGVQYGARMSPLEWAYEIDRQAKLLDPSGPPDGSIYQRVGGSCKRCRTRTSYIVTFSIHGQNGREYCCSQECADALGMQMAKNP